MDWRKMPPQQKLDYLRQQRVEIKRALALIARFERVTTQYVQRLEALEQKKR